MKEDKKELTSAREKAEKTYKEGFADGENHDTVQRNLLLQRVEKAEARADANFKYIPERMEQQLATLTAEIERLKAEGAAMREALRKDQTLRKRIHSIEGHNQFFERCESPWCNPRGVDPAMEPHGDRYAMDRITQLEQQHEADVQALREARDKFDEITEASRQWTETTDTDGDCTIRSCDCSNHLSRQAHAALTKRLEKKD